VTHRRPHQQLLHSLKVRNDRPFDGLRLIDTIMERNTLYAVYITYTYNLYIGPY
jgi:hypothetical protein